MSTIIIIVITCLVSVAALNNNRVLNELIFYTPSVTDNKQWYRFFTSGFIHGDYMHLAFNMYALYLFGSNVEGSFIEIFGAKGNLIYLLMYLSALFFSLLPTFMRHRNDASYSSLGASGAVSAVIFANILLMPLQGIGLVFIPGIFIPGFLFGFIYLIFSSYLDRKGGGNINHSAHIWGALYGMAFLIVVSFALSDYPVLTEFISKIRGYITHF
ncbi:MAG: rhomboid family intramembrane serine protease [Flavitalea sp.]